MEDFKSAWVVYSTIPEHTQQAAFTGVNLANELVECLEAAEDPVLMEKKDITVEIDKYANFLKNERIPYTVLMEEDELFEIWGYGIPDTRIHHIEEFTASKMEGAVHWSKTFWATDRGDAIDQAIDYWNENKINIEFSVI